MYLTELDNSGDIIENEWDSNGKRYPLCTINCNIEKTKISTVGLPLFKDKNIENMEIRNAAILQKENHLSIRKRKHSTSDDLNCKRTNICDETSNDFDIFEPDLSENSINLKSIGNSQEVSGQSDGNSDFKKVKNTRISRLILKQQDMNTSSNFDQAFDESTISSGLEKKSNKYTFFSKKNDMDSSQINISDCSVESKTLSAEVVKHKFFGTQTKINDETTDDFDVVFKNDMSENSINLKSIGNSQEVSGQSDGNSDFKKVKNTRISRLILKQQDMNTSSNFDQAFDESTISSGLEKKSNKYTFFSKKNDMDSSQINISDCSVESKTLSAEVVKHKFFGTQTKINDETTDDFDVVFKNDMSENSINLKSIGNSQEVSGQSDGNSDFKKVKNTRISRLILKQQDMNTSSNFDQAFDESIVSSGLEKKSNKYTFFSKKNDMDSSQINISDCSVESKTLSAEVVKHKFFGTQTKINDETTGDFDDAFENHVSENSIKLKSVGNSQEVSGPCDLNSGELKGTEIGSASFLQQDIYSMNTSGNFDRVLNESTVLSGQENKSNYTFCNNKNNDMDFFEINNSKCSSQSKSLLAEPSKHNTFDKQNVSDEISADSVVIFENNVSESSMNLKSVENPEEVSDPCNVNYDLTTLKRIEIGGMSFEQQEIYSMNASCSFDRALNESVPSRRENKSNNYTFYNNKNNMDSFQINSSECSSQSKSLLAESKHNSFSKQNVSDEISAEFIVVFENDVSESSINLKSIENLQEVSGQCNVNSDLTMLKSADNGGVNFKQQEIYCMNTSDNFDRALDKSSISSEQQKKSNTYTFYNKNNMGSTQINSSDCSFESKSLPAEPLKHNSFSKENVFNEISVDRNDVSENDVSEKSINLNNVENPQELSGLCNVNSDLELKSTGITTLNVEQQDMDIMNASGDLDQVPNECNVSSGLEQKLTNDINKNTSESSAESKSLPMKSSTSNIFGDDSILMMDTKMYNESLFISTRSNNPTTSLELQTDVEPDKSDEEQTKNSIFDTCNISYVNKTEHSSPSIINKVFNRKHLPNIQEEDDDDRTCVEKIANFESHKPDPKLYTYKGRSYKNPIFPKFAKWCTRRLYNYVIEKIKPTYGITSNRRAVHIVKYLQEQVSLACTLAHTNWIDCQKYVENVKLMLFEQGIIETTDDFYYFSTLYLPVRFVDVSVPTIQPEGYNKIPFDPHTVFLPIGKRQ